MRMEKRKFRIGELAHHLAIERFVIRFWEKEFNIKAHRSVGGQRFYDELDLQKFQAIKKLLYEKKFTIAGARQVLEKTSWQLTEQPINAIVASQITTLEETIQSEAATLTDELSQKLFELRKQLIAFKELL